MKLLIAGKIYQSLQEYELEINDVLKKERMEKELNSFALSVLCLCLGRDKAIKEY